MATINTGSNPIENGLVVYAQHVRPIYDALVGTINTDIIVGGNLTLNGGSGYKLDLADAVLTASLARFTNTVSASGDVFVANRLTATVGAFTNITSSLISASTSITAPIGLFNNNIRFANLGAIISGSGSVPIIQHIVTQSGAVGNGLIFGGSQFRDYMFQGANSPRIGIGASTVISTASLASGSFTINIPASSASAATLLISSSDSYVVKVATNTSSQSFAISSSGFVGINTWTPREALDVQLGNAAIKNPTTTSGSILYVENNSGRILDITNQITNSIFTVQTTAGLPIFDAGTNSAGSSYVAVSGNGLGISSRISSSLALISGTLALPFTTGSTVTAGATDVLIVATDNVALPTATSAGTGRYYRVRNAHASNNISVTSTSTVSGIASLGPTSASGYVSDGIGIWYSI
jgi:hypothetical protein